MGIGVGKEGCEPALPIEQRVNCVSGGHMFRKAARLKHHHHVCKHSTKPAWQLVLFSVGGELELE